MSDGSVVHGIIEAGRLTQWAETFNTGSVGNNSSPILREARVHFNDDGLTVSAVGAATVAMFEDTTLAPRAFEAYEAPGAVTIGLSLETFIDRLGPADSGDLVAFDVDMETRTLELSYGPTEMSLALIDPDSIRDEPDSPNLDLPNTVVLEGSDLRHAVDVARQVSDHIYLDGRPDDRQVVFRGQGDIDSATVSYGDGEVIDADVAEDTEAVYSVDYMDALTRPMPGDAEVELTFGDEFPLRLSWAAIDGAFDVNQLLAPRIQST